jgi:GH24 family phage-related lysozyme (muramidase)
MSDFSHAVNLIRKYEGFSEKAYPDPDSGGEPYTIGYGTQFYPDGTPVKQGQCCSKQKALEYLFHEVQIIDIQLSKLNLGLDEHMRQALISFIHFIGGLLDRRREEVNLFLYEVDANPWASTEILLAAFRNYSAAPHEVRAIRELEANISPYVLSKFANDFCVVDNPWDDFNQEELDSIFNTWS